MVRLFQPNLPGTVKQACSPLDLTRSLQEKGTWLALNDHIEDINQRVTLLVTIADQVITVGQ